MPDEPVPWYQSFFTDDYLDVYGHGFNADRAEREAAFSARAIALKPGEDVLDLCCGQGRHSIPIARTGVKVCGLDLSQAYLELAQASAREAGVALETVHADMRAIPFEGRFDAVINMFSSFGYLESEAEDAKVLDSIARALKPGGRVLMDLINREWAVTNYVQNDWHQVPTARSTSSTARLTWRLGVTTSPLQLSPRTARDARSSATTYAYTLREVIQMLERAGLRYETVYGGFEAEPYAIGTWRMIVVATKPS